MRVQVAEAVADRRLAIIGAPGLERGDPAIGGQRLGLVRAEVDPEAVVGLVGREVPVAAVAAQALQAEVLGLAGVGILVLVDGVQRALAVVAAPGQDAVIDDGGVGEVVLDAGHVVPGRQRRMRRLVADQLAGVAATLRIRRNPAIVLLPVDRGSAGAAFVELLHALAAEHFIGGDRHLEVGGERAVVADPVQRLRDLHRAAAFDAAVDDLRGHAEAGLEAVLQVARIGLPGAVDDEQHRRLGRLRVHVEEDRAGQVQPGVGDQFRLVQQWAHGPEHRQRERAVVVVVGQLLGAAAEVALVVAVGEGAAGPGLALPGGRVALAVVAAAHVLGPAHLAHPAQALAPFGFGTVALVRPGFLREVGEHRRQGLAADGVGIPAVGIVAADRRELADRAQEAAIGVLGRAQREQIVPVGAGHQALDAPDVGGVRAAIGDDRFDLLIGQRGDRALDRRHERTVGEAGFVGEQGRLLQHVAARGAVRRGGRTRADQEGGSGKERRHDRPREERETGEGERHGSAPE